ncbi:hypothetical protein FQA39_LY07370 [Lamprigera yunnana]|nr:hypothetical protein FQA39_LY07370 [Lamprigera yunnana]
MGNQSKWKGKPSILQFFDNLFDSVNGGGKSPKELRRAVHENSTHFQFWDEAIKILKHINFVHSAGKLLKPLYLQNFVKTIYNFKVTVSCGFKYLQTRQFNQDPFENFFGQMRQRGGQFVNQTCDAFGPFYKSLLIKNMANKHPSGSNCENDNLDMFFRLKNLINRIRYYSLNCIAFNFFSFERRALNYVAGFIIKKVKPLVKDRESCKARVFGNGPDVNQEYTKQTKSQSYIRWQDNARRNETSVSRYQNLVEQKYLQKGHF